MTASAKIVLTDATCVINNVAWSGIPTLIWPEGIDEVPSDWFRSLVVEQGVLPSSAKEYAKILRPFLQFCRKRRRPWDSVDDQLLMIWRDHLHRAKKVKSQRVNEILNIIFAFYKWAEERRVLRYHVGIYPPDELPEELRNHTFSITAKRWFRKSARGTVFGGWKTTISLSSKESRTPTRHTPTEAEIQRIQEAAIERKNGERDSLMLSWAEETGSRRAEFLSIRLADMPSPSQLADCIEQDAPWTISVRRKGGSHKPIGAPIDLILRTMDYIKVVREPIVEECQRNISGYREPEQIFISSTKGTPLHPDSVTSIGRHAFGKAGVSNASGHRLRARFCVRVIETLVDALLDGDITGPESAWAETILIKAAEIMGQSSPASLRPYLTYVLNRRIQASNSFKAEKLASRLRQMVLHESILMQRLDGQKELQSAARLIRAGANAEAAEVLGAIAERLKAADGA
jgi:site-specific recombinase XerD